MHEMAFGFAVSVFGSQPARVRDRCLPGADADRERERLEADNARWQHLIAEYFEPSAAGGASGGGGGGGGQTDPHVIPDSAFVSQERHKEQTYYSQVRVWFFFVRVPVIGDDYHDGIWLGGGLKCRCRHVAVEKGGRMPPRVVLCSRTLCFNLPRCFHRHP